MNKPLPVPACGTSSSCPNFLMAVTEVNFIFSAVGIQMSTIHLCTVHPLHHQSNSGLTEAKSKNVFAFQRSGISGQNFEFNGVVSLK